MAKKTVSFSLEQDVIDIIEGYQEANKLSSRSVALERLILSKRQSVDENLIRSIVLEAMKDTSKVPEVEDLTDTSIKKAYSSMPD